MLYDMPLYRPPSEAYSLIIQITLGCSHNKCSFCSMYKSKKFTIKSLEQIKEEIDYFRKQYSNVEKIFLADGDALIIQTEKLKEIFKYIKFKFPECERISLYGSPKSILRKSVEELKEFKELGLYMIYMGIESGDNFVLQSIKKGCNSNELLEAALKVKESNIVLSTTVIAGLGGVEKSKNHAINTGILISKINPDFLGVLTLMLEENTELYEKNKTGQFKLLSDKEILEEIKELVKNIDVKKKCVFRSNHASNYISLKGVLPKDKENLIRDINVSIKNNYFKSENLRGL